VLDMKKMGMYTQNNYSDNFAFSKLTTTSKANKNVSDGNV